MAEPDDHSLMLAVRAGATERLAVLFARHHMGLFNYFRKLGHTRSNSEDLVQEAFMRILRYAGSYQPDANFLPWLYGIARNTAHEGWKTTRHDPEPFNDETPAAPSDHEPATAQATRELERCLEHALLRLPRDKRELILLSRVRELSIADLALLFDCSPGAIKVRLHRSLEQLRIYFDQATGTTTAPHEPVAPPHSPRQS
ncbi:MAG TPA: RNA polymerase sigma factor [Hyphomicrobiales bacterium]|nr:RNA polymerase sigma factor [Hyphomicrobiales bacterium]